MRVLVTGATGFIGRALVPVLRRDGHTVVAWVRSEAQARGRLGTEVEMRPAASGIAGLTAALEQCDAVVNLAGEPIMGGRWTAARRRVLSDSRVAFTAQLVEALAAARRRPRVLVSGSAVGYYGDRADEVLTEDAAPGNDFLAKLCRDWEAAAHPAEGLGLRVVMLRTGVVLGRDGGALAQMLPPFRLGAGGPVGSGRQFWPWIHRDDWIALVRWAIATPAAAGALNATAPHPVTNAAFARALGRAMHRPSFMPAPGFALRLLLGEMADALLLSGQNAVPARAMRGGFQFRYKDVDEALRAIFAPR
jgi:uncharacterized protein (TIGR01777 family)